MMSRGKSIGLFLCVFAVVAAVFFYGPFHTLRMKESPDSLGKNTKPPVVSESLFSVASAYPFMTDVLTRIGAPFITADTISQTTAHKFDAIAAFFVLDERQELWVKRIIEHKENIRSFLLRDGRSIPDPDAPQDRSEYRNEEYYWLSPDEMKDVVRFVARSFAELDPVHALHYFDNAYAYAYELDETSSLYTELFSEHSSRFVLIGRGFVPLCTSIDIRPHSFLTREGPESTSMRRLIDRVRDRLKGDEHTIVISDVTFPSADIADAHLRGRLVLLDPYGQLYSGSTYIDFIRENMEKLRMAL